MSKKTMKQKMITIKQTIHYNDLKLIGHIGVDAGLVWIGDPCYVIHKNEKDRYKSIGKDWYEFCGLLYDENKKSKLPMSFNYDMGHEGMGICSSTKYGDGTYPVYMIGDNDGIYIDFLDTGWNMNNEEEE
jgi:hypothetical protein